jgi:hypothetical protein
MNVLMEKERNHIPERRLYPRVNFAYLITYIQGEQEPQKSDVSMARTINISPAGLALEVYEPINPDSCMEMEIFADEHVFSVEGKVVYLRNLPNGNFSIGIMFRKLESKLIKALS